MSIYSTSLRRRGREAATGAIVGIAAAASAVGVLAPVSARAQSGSTIGKIKVVRQVEVTRGVVQPGQPVAYTPARDLQPVFVGQGIRTLKRSLAELDFKDGSVLRVNERSDLVVQDTAALRNIQLHSGTVWVRVAKGVHTQVETPSATAVARGTVFVVGVSADGSTVLTVLEGTVDIQAGGKIVSVHAGESVNIAADGKTPPSYSVPDTVTHLTPSELPVEWGGTVVGWWNGIDENHGLLVTPGTDAMVDLRSSPLTETIQELTAAASHGDEEHTIRITDPKLFVQTVQATSLVSAFNNSGLSLSQYRQNHAGDNISTLGLTSQQLAFFQNSGVSTVGDIFSGLDTVGASATIGVNAGRAQYRFGAVTGEPNFDYRLLDRTETSLSILGVGALLSLASDAHDLKFLPPNFDGSVFGFTGDPDLVGARGRVSGLVGKTRYALEGNVIDLLTGRNKKTFSKIDSVAVVEHPLGDNTTLFAGRRRFYEGPVFQDEEQSQLIADRFSSAGATYRKESVSATAAYLYDANPDVRGAQGGAMGSVDYHVGGGLVGVHYLNVPKVGDGSGFSATAAYPVIVNQLDGYGEIGRAADKANIQTYGAYFPGLYQKTDIDFFIEYSSHEGIGHSLSLIGSRDLAKTLNVRAYATFKNGTKEVKGGVAGIFRFSTR